MAKIFGDPISGNCYKLKLLCAELGIGNQTFAEQITRQEVYMLLIRAFVAQLAAQYEFAAEYAEKR